MQHDHKVPVKLILIWPHHVNISLHIYIEVPERQILIKQYSKKLVLSSLAVNGTTEDFFCVQMILNDHHDIAVSLK